MAKSLNSEIQKSNITNLSPPDSSKIFIDLTDFREYVVRNRHVSGIQRAALKIVEYIIKAFNSENIYFCYNDNYHGNYKAINANYLNVASGDLHKKLESLLSIKKRKKNNILIEKYSRKPIKRFFHTTRYNIWAAIGSEKHFTRRGSTIAEWKGNSNANFINLNARDALKDIDDLINGKDKIFVLGATWGQGMEKMLAQYANIGVEITQLVYDLIPAKAPEFIPVSSRRQFVQWLKEISDYCTNFIVCSEATKRDFSSYLEKNGIDKAVHVIPLARKSPIVLEKNADSRDAEEQFLANGIRDHILNIRKIPFVLCVGTIETRKNSLLLARSWASLQKDYGIDCPQLVFAGKRGWLNDDFFSWMKASGNLSGLVHIIEHPSDEELDFLYRNCLFTAFPSHYEGWGLPVAESLAYGKTAICSNTSSVPEVGGDLVEYCDPKSAESIKAAALRLLNDPDHRRDLERRIGKAELRTWDDVARDFVKLILG